MIRVRRITTVDPLYEQECALRDAVLLRPIGYSMEAFRRDFGIDDRAEHFVAVFDHPSGPRVVGCALLIPDYPHPGVGKLMQMAVDLQRQGEGIGRRLVVELERRAFGELGLREVFCHARDDAMGFYSRLGWRVDGEQFTEVGVPHHRMCLTPPDEDDEGE
ncbi:MAG: GNAT family N-acetyltransferase [Phycisphaerales bacterium]|nr:GNAT family N-acetyltransferase [Phycisphaerales bacterium]